MGRRGSLRSARERRSALLMAMTASSWPMTAFLEFGLHRQELLASVLLHAVQRHAGPLGDDGCIMSSSVTTTSFSSRCSRHSVRMRSSFSLACFSVSRRAAAFSKSCALMAPSFSAANLFDLLLDLLHVRRTGHGGDAGARAGLVHHVDGLVRQEPPREIAVGELRRAASSASSVILAL